MHAHQSQPVVTRVGQVCYETATVLPPQMNVCCLNVSSAGTMLRVWCCSHVGTCVHAQDAQDGLLCGPHQMCPMCRSEIAALVDALCL